MAKREQSITIRVSDEDKARLKKLAAQRDLPMSILVRELLKGSLPSQVNAEDVSTTERKA